MPTDDINEIKEDLSIVRDTLELVVQQTDARSTGIIEKFYEFSAKMDDRERSRWTWLWGIVAGVILVLLVLGFGVYQSQTSQIHEIEKQVIEIHHSIKDIKNDFDDRIREWHEREKAKKQKLW